MTLKIRGNACTYHTEHLNKTNNGGWSDTVSIKSIVL